MSADAVPDNGQDMPAAEMETDFQRAAHTGCVANFLTELLLKRQLRSGGWSSLGSRQSSMEATDYSGPWMQRARNSEQSGAIVIPVNCHARRAVQRHWSNHQRRNAPAAYNGCYRIEISRPMLTPIA